MKKLNTKLAQQYLGHLDGDVQRYNAWLRTLLCAVIDGANAVAVCTTAEAYDFGEWFYGDEGAMLRSLESYAKVAKIHYALHVMSGHIRGQLCAGQRISGEDISVFIDQSNIFRRHVYTLESEIKEHMCALDPLTGVFNRHHMMQRLNAERQRVQRNGHRCAIVLMDIDHFKKVNDLYGHHVGDRALRESAEVVADSLRDYDSMYRIGGEEFLICLPYLDAKRAKIAADRLRNRLKSASIRADRDVELQVTASFGASLLDGDATLEDSISRADQALYAAKHGGRDRVEIWEGS